MRRTILAIVPLLISIGLRADNRVGDADKNGAVAVADAALALGRVLGIYSASDLTPLALADGDAEIDIADVLFISQAANGMRVLTGPGNWLVLQPPAIGPFTSGDPPAEADWTIASNYPSQAARIDNFESSHSSLAATESMLFPPFPAVTNGVANGTLVPINTSGTNQTTNFRLTVPIHNSAGLNIANLSSILPVLVFPSLCGNGLAQPGEGCDDGNAVETDGCDSTCRLIDAAGLCAGVPTASGLQLDSRLVISGLNRPVDIQSIPLDTRRLFIVEQVGTIRILKDGKLLPSPFLNVAAKITCCGERGLLGMAFHPDYAANGRFFVNYTDWAGHTVVAEYGASANPDQADPAETILLTVAQPFANHNGGQLAFGPEGYLYVGLGDGGSGGDPLENAQNMAVLLGKMLRIDVDSGLPYGIPPDNPFAGNPSVAPEIWASGLRNPWRFAFDPLTGDLLIGDVGQGLWEEIDWNPLAVTSGANYGWDVFEGSGCYDPLPHFPSCAAATGLVVPVLTYPHTGGAFNGCSVTGGHVYRGCALPDAHGRYFFSDFCQGFVRSFVHSGGAAADLQNHTADTEEPPSAIDNIVAFGRDARGELHLADFGGGEIYKIVPEY